MLREQSSPDLELSTIAFDFSKDDVRLKSPQDSGAQNSLLARVCMLVVIDDGTR